MKVIKIKNLSYSYNKSKTVLDSIDLSMSSGSVFGLIGPNGAGKTTLMKILLGLYNTSPNSVFIFDKDITSHTNEILSQVGSLVESPTLYPRLTAFEYLQTKQLYCNLPEKNIYKFLELVSIKPNLKTDELSLGMKQRLAIAYALLNEPQLLFLDEPTNGLDPQGIIDMRNLILDLNQNHGISIFLSSHLLSEVEKIVSEVAILGNKKILFNGKIEELKSKQNIQLTIKTSDNNNAKLLIEDNYKIMPFFENNTYIKYKFKDKHLISEVIKLLVLNNIDLFEVNTDSDNLETIYLEYSK